jgi:two-component system sensor histidine kinase KdpD
VFLVVAVTVSALVDVAARLEAAASRSEAEALLLGRVAAAPLASRTPEDVLAEVATAFGLTSVALVDERTGRELARVGTADAEPVTVRVPAGGDRLLLGQGRALFAEDRRLLGDLAHAAGRAADARALADEARRATELAEVDRLRSALLAALGHDLRTPLTSIGTAVDALRQPDLHLGAAEQEQLLGTIEQSTHRLSRLVTDLLDLSRLQAGALRTELVPLPVDEVVARSLLDRQLSDVHNTIGDDLPLVLADATLLERVVSNLADNALRYAPPGAPVEIRATSTPTDVEVAVIDHGPGVAESDWPRMFVPFQRLDDGRTGTGVGLGLAIARGLSEAMGATLRPARTPGCGLTMTLTLPRAAPARATPVP